MPSQPVLVAADTNFLIGLSEARDSAWDALELAREHIANLDLVVTPRVIAELHAHTVSSADDKLKSSAAHALDHLAQWGFRPLETPSNPAAIDDLATTLRELGLLPTQEKNDSFILAEAHLGGCLFLITSDEHLRTINMPLLQEVLLNNTGQTNLVIVTPQAFTKIFYHAKGPPKQTIAQKNAAITPGEAYPPGTDKRICAPACASGESLNAAAFISDPSSNFPTVQPRAPVELSA